MKFVLSISHAETKPIGFVVRSTSKSLNEDSWRWHFLEKWTETLSFCWGVCTDVTEYSPVDCRLSDTSAFRLFGCHTEDPRMPNKSHALRGYPQKDFALYESSRLLQSSPGTELEFSVKHQKDYLFNFVTLLLDMSKSVMSSDKYRADLERAVRHLVDSLIPIGDSVDSYKLKLQVLAFAGDNCLFFLVLGRLSHTENNRDTCPTWHLYLLRYILYLGPQSNLSN